MFLKIITFISNFFKAIKLLGIIGDVKNLIVEGIEAVQTIKIFIGKLQGDLQIEGRDALKQLDDVLEKLADICAKIPGLKIHEQKLRNFVK